MKLIHENLPMEGEETDDWNIILQIDGYVYNIGELDGPPCWFSRKTIEDYENDTGSWEKPTGWVDERAPEKLKFFS